MSEYNFITSFGEKIPICIETRRGQRNIVLRPRVIPKREIYISKPWLVPESEAIRFLEKKKKWIEDIFIKAPLKQKIVVGMELYFLDKRVLLQHDATNRLNKFVKKDDERYVLIVGGESDMLEHRVRDFIKAEFLKAIKVMISETPREFWPERITLRDTTSRWGSCSSSGTISFSWRLAFAPLSVARYVVMHELAHTKYMDHSKDFWHQVSELYGFGVERARRWLNVHGSELHSYL